jgi:hypothetical protein
MAMQYDVQSVHLNQSGFGTTNRVRVKGLVAQANAAASVSIFDSLTAPVTTATYTRTGYTVTVTSTAHGLQTGQRVGITFGVATGGSATNGNYTITRTGADTFTLTDINTGSISGAGNSVVYVSNTGVGNSTQWHGSFDIASGNISISPFPGEGFLIENALYLQCSANVVAVTAFYG